VNISGVLCYESTEVLDARFGTVVLSEKDPQGELSCTRGSGPFGYDTLQGK
jgi:hypothetical protein